MRRLLHCFILTAQEMPENARKIREDLFKKTMSADGIVGRRPYGMSTRMIELVGWKRYEVNSMVRLAELQKEVFHPPTDLGSCAFRRLAWRSSGWQPGRTLLVMETESQMWRLCCRTWIFSASQ